MFPQTKLQDADLLAAKPKPYKISEGGGLYLLVKPDGGKYWRMKYRIGGKERKNYSIGVYPKVSINAAILARNDAKDAISCGIDPVENKKRLLAAKIIKHTTPPVFESIRHEDGGVTIKKYKQSLTVASHEIDLLLDILKLSLSTQRV